MFLADKLNKGGGAAATPDAQFNYVTMLLHGDGTNGAQNNTFVDGSTNNFTISRGGNTTQGSFSPYGSNWSNYFNGTAGNYLQVANNVALQFGTGDFTIEGWFYMTGANFANSSLFSVGAYNSGILLRYASAGPDNFYINNTSYNWNPVSNFLLNRWNHVAMVRNGSTVTIYVNGASVFSVSNSANIVQSTNTDIGTATHDQNNENCLGYISNFRIVKGTAVYTSSFTPSTTPLAAITNTSLLTCQSNRFIDNSSNAFTVTPNGTPSVQRFNPFGTSTAYSTSVIGGSGYFDGSGDSLNATSNAAFQFGTGDFTIEAWVYSTDLSGTNAIFDSRTGASEANGVMFYIRADGLLVMYRNTTVVTASTALSQNSWNHCALTRSGSTCTIWLNGVSVGTASDSTNLSQQNSSIGSAYTGSNNLMVGYISNLRVVKGTAVYTTTFTPPTAPLTAITNTSLLCNMTNGAIFDNAMMNDLETVGNAQISTSVVKYGTGSLAFDGTGDFLKGAYSPWLALGTGDYTIELWVNFNSVSTSVFFGNISGTGAGDWAFFYNSSVGVLRFLMNNTAVLLSSSSWTPSTGTWYHIAICRASGTYRFFVNGTVTGSGSDSTNISYTSGNPFYVGSTNDQQLQLNGYIDDLRITKGYARYTTTFTPPTAAFSNTGPI